MLPDATVVRLGHRQQRDKRITSHLGLTARALGAQHFVLCGDQDQNVLDTLDDVTNNFGGNFNSEHQSKPMKWLKRFANDGGQIIHLTMYGQPYEEITPEIPKDSPIAIVVGGAKVPGEIYKIANFNVSVGNQPHSEVAALALFMAEYMGGVAGSEHFSDAKLEIKPHPSGKVVIDHTEDSDTS
ncbi:MAG: tRNA (cytidine(56)-2'-O)-methyltransferase [Candidatus Thalassarchaeaceae archaeon]|jgi:tRNA (cytidine56-2'-O)-methyltransferase|nr:tRNA (cytidine(56)-2'-O)-methyltransferase [Candidatus Thalassarchaeaceae archaeon]